MYSSGGSNAYGQQPYGSQSAYGQTLGPGYSGSSVGVPESSSHVSLSSRHSSMLGPSQEAEIGGYRGHTSAVPHYGGQYSSIYGSNAVSGAQQVPAINIKGAGSTALEGLGGYASAISDSPKFASSEYLSTSSGRGYGHKGDQIYAEKIPDYSDRRPYGERQSNYLGRDLPSESTGRFADVGGYGQHEMYDRIDQTSLLRQEQLLKAQSLQSSSLDGGSRQADYLAARGPASRHSTQDLMPYRGRADADPRNISMLSTSTYSGQHAPSILGAAPRRNVDDLMPPQSSSDPGYGVSLPPGRNYATGKGLPATSIESDYHGSIFSRSSHPIIDERKDDRASYLREFELREEERRREHLREREKEREREKVHERERERERKRERQRQREREWERERMFERREKERERERKREIEIKRDRTPARVSKDRRGPSLTKEGRSVRRDSPHHEALHRRHSPVREKRREYICKVTSSSLVDVDRDYLSLDKRYPRLFVSPEVSKVVVNWPKEDIELSIHTPVSFEHDFIEEESGVDSKVPSPKLLTAEPEESEQGSTVWNAKIILMSGLSRNALDALSSEKSFDDRIPHICNILRFAVLKKDHSFMALGGPWNSADGSDPSVDSSSLVQTAIRYAKNVTQLDLQNCRNWNRFLEIHYDRLGNDGLFSHKEVTVFFVPDLSQCLPSLDTWQTQWLAHKKAVAKREHQLSLKKERSREDGLKDKEMDSSKDVERTVKSENKKGSSSSGQAAEINKKEKSCTDLKGNATNQKGNGSDKKVEKIDGSETGGEGKIVEKKDSGETAAAQTTGSGKPGKKKVVRRIVKQKVVDKAASGELDGKDAVEKKNVTSEVSGEQEEPSSEPPEVKTFTRKKVAKKVIGEDTSQNDNKDIQIEVKAEEMDQADDKPKDDSVPNSTAAVQDTGVRKTIKKKIIKRVVKRKVTGKTNDAVNDVKIDDNEDKKSLVQPENKTEDPGRETADTEKKTSPEMQSRTPGAQKLDSAAKSSKTEIKDEKEGKKDERRTDVENKTDKEKVSQKDTSDGKMGNPKDGEKSKVEKSKNDKDGKVDSRLNSNKEGKERRKPEEPPQHPGLILRTKWNNDSKLRSLSLSLDSLLDYTDKDIEESSLELSLFAETLYEMLQYQMGCRLLDFLQRLRIKFLKKRNERKRQRSEIQEKENDKKSPKRSKTDELAAANKSTETEKTNSARPDDKKTVVKEDTLVDHVNKTKVEEDKDEAKLNEETDEEEDPEEDPEEDEEMGDASSQLNSSNEDDEEEVKTDANAQHGKEPGNEKDKADESNKEKTITQAAEAKHTSDVDMGEKGERNGKARKKEVVDKELLQAFRFFDRNQVGHIRVEDLRLIIHSLGKFLSHRDVKELVQSALLESNTGRDDRILYNKLVTMCGI